MNWDRCNWLGLVMLFGNCISVYVIVTNLADLKIYIGLLWKKLKPLLRRRLCVV